MPSAMNTPLTRFMDEPVLTDNGRRVLEARYLKKNEKGDCVETAAALFGRVATTMANVELDYGASEHDRRNWERRYYDMMARGLFMPNSPTLMNAGREMGMLSACFVLPVRDSITDIFDSIKHTALIQKAGGGTGFAFDELRPTGDYIKSSGGTTSGPITFWRAFSEATNAIQQGAFRRGANMGMMYIHHPDILKFLHAKQDLDQFTNYNISVKVTDAWMEEFQEDPDSPHVVRNPRTGKAFLIPKSAKIWEYDVRDLIPFDAVEEVPVGSRQSYYTTPRIDGAVPVDVVRNAYTKQDIWNIIVDNAWQTGEPGVVFIDRINEHNPTPQVGRIEATNPCGEQPLLPYEACNLGSVNLGLFVRDDGAGEASVDWDALRETVHVATRFLDNVIDANNYPLPEIAQICRANRKIGLGIMGFADALYRLGVPYNSEEGVNWGRRFMKFVNDEAHNYSEQLARERGCFENWQGSIWHTRHNRMMRNAAVTTVAPTGTISIIANCSGGIEPLFSLAFLRNVLRGQKHGDRPLIEVNETFRTAAQARGVLSDKLLDRIIEEGTLAHIDDVPEDMKRVFVCAHDITPEWHMRMQAGFQQHCDSSISKTINFAETATREDVERIYRLAFEYRCKGVTVYRNNCRKFQPMSLKDKAKDEAQQAGEKPVAVTAPAPIVAESTVHGAPTEPSAGRTVESAAPVARTIEPVDLPEIVSGFRIRQMTPFGNMHVKITVDPRTERELEIFAQLGKGGDVANSDLEGLCRIASLWLRAGGALRPLIKQWEGIGSSMQVPTRAGRIMSLPDGLACALKKYLRAKERFGLRALLLGEISPSDMENPRPAPHRPETTPVDRPGNGGPQGGVKLAAPARVETPAVLQRMESSVETTRETSVSRQTQRAETPRAAAGANGNGNGNGNGGRYAPYGSVSVAVAEPLDEVETEEETVVTTVTIDETEAVDMGTLLASVRHTHDAAAHYKLRCVECGQPLVLQEGCRKCLSCGWAAC